MSRIERNTGHLRLKKKTCTIRLSTWYWCLASQQLMSTSEKKIWLPLESVNCKNIDYVKWLWSILLYSWIIIIDPKWVITLLWLRALSFTPKPILAGYVILRRITSEDSLVLQIRSTNHPAWTGDWLSVLSMSNHDLVPFMQVQRTCAHS